MNISPTPPRGVDVAIAGAGVIGLACAWRLAQRGLNVVAIDPHPAAAASRAAAGMLAPASEVTYGEAGHLRLATASLRRYPAFVAELEAATGTSVGLRRDGTVIVATDSGDRAMLEELHAFQATLGLSAQLLTSRECRALEPMLSPDIRCGLLVEDDHSVDNRRLCDALQVAAASAGATIVRDRVAAITIDSGRATGVRCEDGPSFSATHVLVTAGPWSGQIEGVPAEASAAVRPVKGEILRLRIRRGICLPDRSIRGIVNGRDIYLVPRTDGELVVGATVEEAGFDTSVRGGAVRELLRDARAVMPLVDELELVESMAALRPGSPDNEPSIGPTSLDGLLIATGHYRNGILLAPATADLITATIMADGCAEDHALLRGVSPGRFAPIGARP